MSHTLAAVFDNRASAEQARQELISSGIGADSIQLSSTSSSTADASAAASTGSTSASGTGEHSMGDSIRNFFSNMFGDDDDDRHVYGEAVNRGNVVLTVQTPTQDEVERAADIIERFGPLDIDEQRSQWEAGGWSAATARGLGASSGLSASQQSGSLLGSSQSGTTVSGTQGALLSGSQGYSDAGSMQRATTDEQVIPVMEEELKVGKRMVQRGGVRIYQRLVETPVQESVSLREEHVNVERRPVDRPIDPSQVGAFQETSFELRENAEEAVVQKTARVVEEVVVGKEVTQRTDQISDTVRHTEVEVEQLGGMDDDAYFRTHWTSNFASAGGSYDDYAPAYRYGASMRRDASYSGRSWDESEAGLRSSWETQYPQSAWEKMKAAVRHGWERITQ
ncbi:YsnF/AvaK domain-containing protein [Massilia sp. METH4]|uniref:YsnF/AvaK domain-containing protein n=1 Tax=Massilia sp. METH4 TaxID=3123041 RepID=UPI0030D5CCA0